MEVECSEEDGFVEDILDDAYQAVDLVAFPDAACVVELEDGSILDLMLMQGKWFKFKRDDYS